jgi:hypothetical protein
MKNRNGFKLTALGCAVMDVRLFHLGCRLKQAGIRMIEPK